MSSADKLLQSAWPSGLRRRLPGIVTCQQLWDTRKAKSVQHILIELCISQASGVKRDCSMSLQVVARLWTTCQYRTVEDIEEAFLRTPVQVAQQQEE